MVSRLINIFTVATRAIEQSTALGGLDTRRQVNHPEQNIMLQQRKQLLTKRCTKGFSLPEVIITASILGVLGSVAYPTYNNANDNAKLAEAKAQILSIPPIIGAYIDETGEAPTTWEDLSTIATVMTNNGPATGDLTSPITLPSSIYGLSIEGPAESIYTLTASRVLDRGEEEQNEEEDQFAIKSCFNISNGASELRTGNLTEIKNKLNCR
jgi:prepilin-type N-terminal cleavage/methylation domain-containing protein